MSSEFWASALFNYLPHIAIFLLIFGAIGRLIYMNKSIHAKSTQFLQDDKLFRTSLMLFHWGILCVLLGHFLGLLVPRPWYEWFMSVETKRLLAIWCGSLFGICAFLGILSITIRLFRHERVRINSGWGDIGIEILLVIQIAFGLSCTGTTMDAPVSNYLLFDTWAQAVVSFQPDAGQILLHAPLIYKIHIVTGCLIFIIFPYSKLMHFFVAPVQYIWRKSTQLVWSRKHLNAGRI